MASSTHGATPRSGTVRVPVRMMRPSVLGFGKAVWRFSSGAVDADFVRRAGRMLRGQSPEPGKALDPDAPLGITPFTFAPLALKATKASYVFDARGVRLEGVRRMPLAVEWSEVRRVSVRLLDMRFHGLTELQLVLWPADENVFARAHPRGAQAWDPELRALVLPLSRALEIPQRSIDGVLAGAAYAGDLFDGTLEHVQAPPQPPPGQGPA